MAKEAAAAPRPSRAPTRVHVLTLRSPTLGPALTLLLALIACSGTNQPEVEIIDRSGEEPLTTARPAAPQEAGNETILEGTIRWRIEAEPAAVNDNNRDAFRLRVIATNEGEIALDPGLGVGRWTFDGAEHHGLSLNMSNGIRVNEWTLLPPGATAIDQRGMGAMLTEPGEHSFEYTRAGQTLVVYVVVR